MLFLLLARPFATGGPSKEPVVLYPICGVWGVCELSIHSWQNDGTDVLRRYRWRINIELVFSSGLDRQPDMNLENEFIDILPQTDIPPTTGGRYFTIWTWIYMYRRRSPPLQPGLNVIKLCVAEGPRRIIWEANNNKLFATASPPF